MSTIDYLASARRTFDIEISALQALKDSLGAAFTEAVQRLLACRGRVVVTGIGKSGHIGRKIAATFASTGTPAFFIDRKSTRLNSSHVAISYAVFCLKK